MENESPRPLPDNRAFGFLFTLVFALVGAWFAWRGAGAYRWWFVASCATLLLALAWPALLAPFNRVWMQLGALLNQVVSPLVLGILFYVMVTPTGVVKRLTGWNPMRNRFDPQASSYWIDRDPPGPPSDSLKNQF